MPMLALRRARASFTPSPVTAVKYPALLKPRYGTDNTEDIAEIMNAVCVKRGFLLKGGDFDYDRCSTAIIDDFRKGRIGKIFIDDIK